MLEHIKKFITIVNIHLVKQFFLYFPCDSLCNISRYIFYIRYIFLTFVPGTTRFHYHIDLHKSKFGGYKV